MSIAGNRKTTIGVGHDGAPHPGAFVPANHPNALASHPHAMPKVHSGMADVTNVKATLGKAPKPKRANMTTPPIAGGMTAKSRRTDEHFHNVGGQDLSRYDASGPDPLAGAPRGKRLTDPQPVPGQRSRITDPAHGGAPGEAHAKGRPDAVAMRELGARILAEATCAPDDAMALRHYGVGTLPQVTKEQS